MEGVIVLDDGYEFASPEKVKDLPSVFNLNIDHVLNPPGLPHRSATPETLNAECDARMAMIQ